jgi:uncharacterized protein
VLLLYVLASLALAPFALLSSKSSVEVSMHQKQEALRQLGALPLWPSLLLATFAGFYEELIFRGFLLMRLCDGIADLVQTRGKQAAWAALLVSSLLFAVGHIYQGSIGVIQTFVVGFALGGLRLMRKNLIAPIAAHVAIDVFGFAMLHVRG